jgi:Putative DNA-binding domain
MLSADFDQIKIDQILQLVSEKIPESRVLDYKLEIPAKGKASDTKEFLADIGAFGNAAGGDIIYGVAEERDSAGGKTGLPGNAEGIKLVHETPDEAQSRLHQLAQSGLDPAIPGLRIRSFSTENGLVFFVVRIPSSWLIPHMISQESSRFPLRNDSQRIWMDRERIRQAFLFAESTRTRVERFRDERLARILSGTVGVPLQSSWKRVTHLIPLAALNGSLSIDVSVVDPPAGSSPKFAGLLQRRPNVDGIMGATHVSGEFPSLEVFQVFRNGIIEHIHTGGKDPSGTRGNVPAMAVENSLLSEFSNYFEFYRSQSVPMPIVAMVSLLDVGKRHLLKDAHEIERVEYQFDRPNILLPEIIVNDYDIDLKTALMPLLDSFWQAGGHRRSPNYNRLT